MVRELHIGYTGSADRNSAGGTSKAEGPGDLSATTVMPGGAIEAYKFETPCAPCRHFRESGNPGFFIENH
jgi:hypothetical protein